MKLCYQVATPDVKISPDVTAFQGELSQSFGKLGELGYDGAELMTLNPKELNWDNVKKEAEKNNLSIPLVCTGEIFGQLKLSFMDRNPEIRNEAIKEVKEIIEFASYFGANINIGRVRGQYCKEIPKEISYRYAIDAFKNISDYAGKRNVKIALENVTYMQTNFVNTIEEAAKIVEDVDNENFKLMMDIYHMNIEEKDILQSIKKYSKYNIYVHLADNNRRYPGNCGFDFKKIISTFKNSGYDGAFTTEIYQLPDQETAAAETIEYLRPILNEIYKK